VILHARQKYLLSTDDREYGIVAGFGIWIEVNTIVDGCSVTGPGDQHSTEGSTATFSGGVGQSVDLRRVCGGIHTSSFLLVARSAACFQIWQKQERGRIVGNGPYRLWARC
jgi:hypothetical protein